MDLLLEMQVVLPPVHFPPLNLLSFDLCSHVCERAQKLHLPKHFEHNGLLEDKGLLEDVRTSEINGAVE